MSDSRASKLQYLLVKELMEEGTVQLLLPDGISLEIGITKEDQMKKLNDYCYVTATRERCSTTLDSYNMGLQFEDREDKLLYEDEAVDDDGIPFRRFEVI